MLNVPLSVAASFQFPHEYTYDGREEAPMQFRENDRGLSGRIAPTTLGQSKLASAVVVEIRWCVRTDGRGFGGGVGHRRLL